MFILDVLLMSVEGLRERKFRFSLNLLGILIGVSAITGLISITQGLNTSITGQLEIFGSQNVVVIPGQFQQGQAPVLGTLTKRDLDIVRDTLGVVRATPMIVMQTARFEIQGRVFTPLVFGLGEDYFIINQSPKVAEGRPLQRTDSSAIIIGPNIAHPEDEEDPIVKIGDRIKLEVDNQGEPEEHTFRVVGIIEKSGTGFGISFDDAIAMPVRTAQQIYGLGGEFDRIIAQAESLEAVDFVANRLQDRMGDDVTVMTSESVQQTIGSVLGTIEAVLGGIAAISLVVAGVGIINTMTISVMERTKEIGILKAVGAKSLDILLLFIFESAFTGLVGGTLGAAFGFFLSGLIGGYIDLPVSTSYTLGVYVVGFAMLTSTLSGIYPAWRAANMHPVDALRNEK